MMKNLPLNLPDVLSAARALVPPKCQIKHAPRVTAQHQLFAMLNGEAVTLSEAEWRAIPPIIKLYHMRRIRIKGGLTVYGIKSDPQTIKAVMGYLIQCRWTPPPAPCKPASRGGEQQRREG